MNTRGDWEDSIKFDVLTNWLVNELEKEDYISTTQLRKLLKALNVYYVEFKEENIKEGDE